MMTNKVVREASRCTNCMVDKSKVSKQKHNNINPKFFTY